MIDDETNITTLMEQISPKIPDLLEIRLDRLSDHGILEVIADRKPCPLIATDRSNRNLASKLEELTYAAEVGFDFVDLDLSAANADTISQVKTKGARIILSFHDYSLTPPAERLIEILGAEKKLGSDICKIVTTAHLPRDNLTILGFVESEAANARLVSFAMGARGVPSRVLSPWFGAEFTFAALSAKSTTGDGQLTIDELRSAWQILGLQ